MARTPPEHRRRRRGHLGALRSAAQPYAERELYVDVGIPGCPPFDFGSDAPPPDPVPPPPSMLRQSGNWTVLVTPPGSASTSIAQADLLASELVRIAGSGPDRQSWVGQPGIRVGLRSDWIAAGASLPTWSDWDWFVGLDSGGQPYVLGRTLRGLTIAIRRVLHLLGYRCLAPGAAWEVLPSLGADVPVPTEGPAAAQLRFLTGIGNGCGLMSYQQTRLSTWEDRNGIFDDGAWDLGHAYGRIKQASPADFTAHPEWLPGGPTQAGNKLCVFEPGLRAEALEWALGRIAIVADLSCVSMAAADGTVGWTAVCTGTGEQATSTPSDRQVALANYVQGQLRSQGSQVRVGILAYGDMSAPPSLGVTVDPDVVVVYASQYMVDGQTAEQVRDAYLAAGAEEVATYGYPSVWTQDFDEPGIARATQRSELDREYGRVQGAVGWTGEGSPAWVPCGRWYWSHVGGMFGEDPRDRWDDYPATAFPSALTAAAAWYDTLEARQPLSTDLVHRLCQAALDLMDAVDGSPTEEARALDLARYAVWVDLHRRYKVAPSAATLEPSMRWTYRVAAVDGWDGWTYRCAYFTTPWQTDRKAIAATYGLSDLSPFVPVWPATATTEAEVRTALATAIATNPTLPFTPVGFTEDLVLPEGLVHAGTRASYVYQLKPATWWLSAAGATIFTIRGGIAFQNKGPDRVRLYEAASGETVADWSIPADGVTRDYTAATVAHRRYRVEVTPAGGVDVDWITGTAMTLVLSVTTAPFQASFSGYFFVPTGTTVVGFFANTGPIRFFGSDNVQIGTTINAAATYYSVAVPEGQDGVPWKVTGVNGKFELMTVPPGIAMSEEELMIPREVLEAEGLVPADATPAPTRDYTPVSYSTGLVAPSVVLTGTGSRGDYIYASRALVAYAWGSGSDLTLTIKGGIASQTKGPDAVTVTDLTTLLQVVAWSIPEDKVARPYQFSSVAGRLYRIDVTPAGGVDVDWAVGTKIVYKLDANVAHQAFIGSYSGWFYVPKGTPTIGFFADGGTIRFYNASNQLVTTFTAAQDYHSFAVPAGRDGQVWRFTGPVGRFEIETVPRSVARGPGELLLPPEVITADGI